MDDIDDLSERAPSHADPEVASRILRFRMWRGISLLLVSLAALIAIIVLAIVMIARADALLATGSRTPGVVVDTADPGFISVRYTVDGVEMVREIVLYDTRTYETGDQVTIIYDPAHPERFRTPEEENDPIWVALVVTGLVVAMVVALPVGVFLTVRWGRRSGSVRLHGWRLGTAIAVERRRRSTILAVEFGDWIQPGGMRVQTIRATDLPYPGDPANGDIAVGGAGGSMVVMFRTGSVLLAAKSLPG